MRTTATSVLLSLLIPVLISCSANSDQPNDRPKSADYIPEYEGAATELTDTQQAAFDALNVLQTSTDEMNRLYSTFPDIIQPFYPPDTTVRISREELMDAMQQFVGTHCTALPEQKQMELIAASVEAQEQYDVLWCKGKGTDPKFEEGIPRAGVWVLPNILGRRDLVLEW